MRTLLAAVFFALPALAQDAPPQLPPLGAPAGAFGAALDDEVERVELEKLLADPDAFAGKTIAVEAPIDDVCRKKGCWMVLSAGERSMRVKFKDYAFFVPRDAHGRRALIQGTASVQTISEAQARHYAEESGDPETAKAIQGPQKVVSFLATGVEVFGSFELPPEVKVEAAEALAARLVETDEERARTGGGAAPEQALAALRRVPGARTREFAAMSRVGAFFLFGDAAFARGFAVHAGSLRVIDLEGGK